VGYRGGVRSRYGFGESQRLGSGSDAPAYGRRGVPALQRFSPTATAEAVVGARPMSWLARLPIWRGALILGYHRIHPENEGTAFDPGTLSATPSTFDAQLRFLSRHFEVVSPEALTQASDFPGRRVVLTFDDGYRDNYELAFPILRKHGLPAAFFLATRHLDEPGVAWWDELAWMVNQSSRQALDPGGWLGRPLHLGDRRASIAELARVYKSLPSDRTAAFLDFCAEAAGTGRCEADAAADLWMTWEMACELRDAGMTIGGHSATHPVLGRAEPELQAREIEECARRLDEELGIPMEYFAYPVGLQTSFNDETRRILSGSDVKLAFSLYGGYLRPGQLDPLDVPRASVATKMSPAAFRAMLILPRFFARW